MVGVGGRSKACSNCKRGHLKCDLTKPGCGQCALRGLQCGGPQSIVIIPYNKRRNTAPSRKNSCNDPNARAFVQQVEKTGQTNAILTLPVSYDDVFTAFTNLKLLPGTEKIVLPPEFDRTITEQCFLALSYTYFGAKHQDKGITQHGLQRYGQALGTVNRALIQHDAAQSFDVLEAVTILAMIEFLISDRENGWVNHARGLELLLDMRGSENMTSLPCLMILEKTRPSIILAAIVLRQPTVLAEAKWKKDPWKLHPERIDSMKLLLDILSDCAELFVMRDRISKDSEDIGERDEIHTIMIKGYRILEELEQWEKSWTTNVAHACIEVPSPPTAPFLPNSDGKPELIWSTVFQYDSLYTANTVTMYNAALVLVLHFIRGLEGKTTQGISQVLQERIRTAGITICRSVDYHHGDQWGEQGGFFLLFPLRMAYDAIGKTDPVIGMWLKGVLDDIAAGRRGLWKSAKTMLSL